MEERDVQRLGGEAERHQMLIAEAALCVARAGGLPDALRDLSHTILSFIPHTFCRVLMLDDTRQFLEVGAACPLEEPPTENAALRRTVRLEDRPELLRRLQELTPESLHHGLVEHRPALERLSRQLELDALIQTLMLVPLRLEEGVAGFLEFAETRAERARAFGKDELELCAAVADAVSVQLSRMHLHEQTRRNEQRFRALHQASLHFRAERGEHALLPELVNLAARLAGCSMSGLFANHPHLKELELISTHGLPAELLYARTPYAEGVICRVAQTGVSLMETVCPADDIFAALKLKALIAVPVQNEAGEVEAVLFVADHTGGRQFVADDLVILECLAAQASLQLQTSRLLSREQRSMSKLNTLYRFSDYAQAAPQLDEILHVVLTGVTADYGLRFNRAALLFLDLDGKTLRGRTGIGHLDEQSAARDWEIDEREGLTNLGRYIGLLEAKPGLPATPIAERISNLSIPLDAESPDIFFKAITERCLIRPGPEELHGFPAEFTAAFAPAAPCVVVPLVTRERVVGVLVADNKFTRVPVTDEDITLLHTFINNVTLALENRRLLEQTQAGLRWQRVLSEANAQLFSDQNPRSVLEDIVRQTPAVAGASWVRVVLVDELGRPREQFIGGHDGDPLLCEAVRPGDISEQVMRTGQAAVIEDVREHGEWVNPSFAGQGIEAALCFPLTLQGKNIGVMWIYYGCPRRFQPFEVEALRLYVNQAALAYARARQVGELERLHKAKRAMSSAVDLGHMLQTIVDEAVNMFQADSACIWSFDDIRGKFLPDEMRAVGVSAVDFQVIKELEPTYLGTAYEILNNGWVHVSDTAAASEEFLRREGREHLSRLGVRSFQGIVLQVGNEGARGGRQPAGVLYLNYKEPRACGDEERRALQNFATYAALALKNARLLEQVRRIKQTAEVVARVSTLGEDPNATLNSIVEGTRHALGCDAVVLYAYDDAKNAWQYPPIHSGVHYPEEAWRRDIVPATSVVFKILNSKEPFHIAERGAEDGLGLLNGRFARNEQVVSCAALPLRAAGQSVGVMFVNYRSRARLTADDLSNIKLFADQAAVALRNFQLFAASRKKLREQRSLLEYSQALLGAATPQGILDNAVKVARQLLEADLCHVMLRVGDGKLILSAAVGPGQEQVGEGEFVEGTGSQIGYTIMTGGAVVVEDSEREARFDVHLAAREGGVRSSMSVPMFIEGEIIGAMQVDTKEYHRFTAAQQSLLQLLANQTAVAVQRARLHEDLKRTKGLVGARTALAWMGMASNVWWHAVNTHAVTIRDQVTLLERALSKSAPDAISPALLAEAGRRLADIQEVNNGILDKVITPPLAEENADSVLIDVLVRERVRQLWAKEPYRSFPAPAVSTACAGVSVRINECWLKQALDHLIDNAIKAMADTPRRQLSVGLRRSGGFIEISITDTGRGIPPEVLSVLFNQQIKKAAGSKGLGVGLMLVQCIVEAYRGEVAVVSTGPSGTTMSIRLPCEPPETFEGDPLGEFADSHFLLVGDPQERHWRGLLEETLAPLGRVEVVGEEEAAKRISARDYRAVIIDAGVVDKFARLASRLRTQDHNARIIIVTAAPGWQSARAAFQAGATDFLCKSGNKQELFRVLEGALSKPLSLWPR